MEDKLLSPRPSFSANTVAVCNVVRSVHIFCVSILVLLYVQCHSFTVLIADITLQWCRLHVHQYVYILCPSALWLSSYISHQSLSPLFKLILYPKFFSIFFLFGLTVLQRFIVSVCKLSDGDENKLSMYNLCRTFSILAVSPVTVAREAVMEGITRFLSLFIAVFIAL